jgi:hypothetical protein
MTKKSAEAVKEAAEGKTDPNALSAAAETQQPDTSHEHKGTTLAALERRVAVLERILLEMGYRDRIGVNPDGAK